MGRYELIFEQTLTGRRRFFSPAAFLPSWVRRPAMAAAVRAESRARRQLGEVSLPCCPLFSVPLSFPQAGPSAPSTTDRPSIWKPDTSIYRTPFLVSTFHPVWKFSL